MTKPATLMVMLYVWEDASCALDDLPDRKARRAHAAACLDETALSIEARPGWTVADDASSVPDTLDAIDREPNQRPVDLAVRFETMYSTYRATFVVIDGNEDGRREVGRPRLYDCLKNADDHENEMLTPVTAALTNGLEHLGRLLSEVVND